MGSLGDDLIKLGATGLIVGAIAQDYQKQKNKGKFCDECGTASKIVGKCSDKRWYGDCEKWLCKKCMNRCKDCKKNFCSKHIEYHKCK